MTHNTISVFIFCLISLAFVTRADFSLTNNTRSVIQQNDYISLCDENCKHWNNLRCLDSYCYCMPNYKLDDLTKRCVRSYCKNDPQCWLISDLNRHCSNSECVCDDNYYEDDNYKCAKRASVWAWVWVFIVLPVALAVAITLCIRRRRMRARPVVVTTTQPQFVMPGNQQVVHVYRY